MSCFDSCDWILIVNRDSIAQWLASTAKKHGYIAGKGKGAVKPIAQGRPTYTVALKEWVALAEFIAGKTPPVLVPVKIVTLLDTTITRRQTYSDDVFDILGDSTEERQPDDKHMCFLNVLKKSTQCPREEFTTGARCTSDAKDDNGDRQSLRTPRLGGAF
jgi:hypothetical protein